MKQKYPGWCCAWNLLRVTNSNSHESVWAVNLLSKMQSSKCESFKGNATDGYKTGMSHMQCSYELKMVKHTQTHSHAELYGSVS